ncbi:hypothetical protein GDO78_017030 [Eleutherodactylus coqui]|uniref:Uncharacterized protein n=1 Tax=Eleutherodactylus coqui TaxID=57060 RepID=A0A8J6C2Y7_ELECQ|nr:hypothetical protein GDO78_017030 [Eleutherodactylus coqui]
MAVFPQGYLVGFQTLSFVLCKPTAMDALWKVSVGTEQLGKRDCQLEARGLTGGVTSNKARSAPRSSVDKVQQYQ